MVNSLTRRVALVTGASAGIGRATAVALAREGAEVIVTGRRQAELNAVAEECVQVGGRTNVVCGDLNDSSFIRELGEAASHADILVNNAGILNYAPLRDTLIEDCEAMFRSNVIAAFAIAREIVLRMVARQNGHLIFVTSLSARNVNPLTVSYAATKHALSAYAKGFRAEFKSSGIKVTEVAPGMVATGIRDNSTHPDVVKSIAARAFAPLTPDDVAQAIVYALMARDGCCPDLIELRPVDN